MLQKGDKFRDIDGTVFEVLGTADDIYNYFFIANLTTKIITKMLPKNAEMFVKDMEKFN
ncbi:hypothetical protein VKX94_02100 [Lactobacillus helveticus]|uniref:Uncharacterized protein n=1 Tax=Lactobacillus helveticus CIRM-BIA 951 TaxID=1226334 RepID=U6F6I7_LACHE|nr:hypothetical protein [Lactobacillus helveticus]MDY0990916.1 hypothetical protein [Lactobacillus helveticus]MDY1001585.1 hypothetical protein [Lactobacillus helveticus]MEB2873437.1 hypothetical protein [Lactobacillus helveticus]CDI58584.1 Predicted protein [Lactobacillus helveticus CIRM-BIA 951]